MKIITLRLLFIFSILILNSCNSSSDNIVQNEDVDNVRSEKQSEVDCESPPEPEIYDLNEFGELLLQADLVVAYNFNGNNGNPATVECEDLYAKNNKLCKSASNKRQLNKLQVNELVSISTDSSTFNGNWSGFVGTCFIPHLGFRFFKNDELISQISVCFLCDGIRTRPFYSSDGLTNEGEIRFAKFARKLNLNVVDGTDRLIH